MALRSPAFDEYTVALLTATSIASFSASDMNPSVLMSSAAQPNGERPAKRIMYQNIQVKSKPAGKAMKTGLPGSLSTQST